MASTWVHHHFFNWGLQHSILNRYGASIMLLPPQSQRAEAQEEGLLLEWV
jgi:hypothetical protein